MFHSISHQSQPHFQLSSFSGQRYQGGTPGQAVRWTHQILETALDQGASDIHLEPAKEQLGVLPGGWGPAAPCLPSPRISRNRCCPGSRSWPVWTSERNGCPRTAASRAVGRAVRWMCGCPPCPLCSGEKLVLRLLDREAPAAGTGGTGFQPDQPGCPAAGPAPASWTVPGDWAYG